MRQVWLWPNPFGQVSTYLFHNYEALLAAYLTAFRGSNWRMMRPICRKSVRLNHWQPKLSTELVVCQVKFNKFLSTGDGSFCLLLMYLTCFFVSVSMCCIVRVCVTQKVVRAGNPSKFYDFYMLSSGINSWFIN